MTFFDAISILLAAERDPALQATGDYNEALNKLGSTPQAKEWFEDERNFYAQHEGLLSAATLRPASRERIRNRIAAGVESPLHAMYLDSGLSGVQGGTQPESSGAITGVTGGTEMTAYPSTHEVQPEPVEASRPPIDFPRRSLMWFGAAAAIALGAFLILPKVVSQNGRNIQAASFVEFGSLFLDGPININKRLTVADSADLLEEEGGPIDRDDLATCLQSKTVGCCVLSWNDRNVSLICMEPEPGRVVHVMVMATEDLTQDERDAIREGFQKVNERETQQWTRDGKTYLALAHKRNETLKMPPNLLADNS